jgi:pimeloyl-ACP methyl ester carboxylesterase
LFWVIHDAALLRGRHDCAGGAIPYTDRSMVRILLAALFLLSAPGAVGAPNRIPSTIQVGPYTLYRCSRIAAYCGEFDRPLDPIGEVPGRISIHVEFYPHTGPRALGPTLVATEGGPGYPATLSRDDYLALLAPLRAGRDVLLMDNRGTGLSGAIVCHALQTAAAWTISGVAACGQTLGARAPLYGTAYATDDLAVILQDLGITQVDLYGDSYGTYFAQVFALRHPALLHRLVLDGAYPLNGPDYAWYPSYAPAMRAKFNLACARSAACAALPGSGMDHILPALELLRAEPFSAEARDGDGRDRTFDADAAQLAIVMFGSAPAAATVRELDAAARAFTAGDRIPLLRLMAETIAAVDSRDPTDDARQWSAGLAAAVMCHDPPQIFDMRLPPEARAIERDRVIAERERTAPDTYAPFTIEEIRAMPLDYSFLDQCVGWPVASAAHPAARIGAADGPYPDVPALIVSGELDNITTVADGAAAAREFRRGRQVVIANSFHVNALPRARSACGATLVRRFLATGNVGLVDCAAAVPPLRLVARFARRLAELPPAKARSGNQADAAMLRAAQATLQTVGDILARIPQNTSGSGKGLRGGSFLIVEHGRHVHVSVYQVRWTEDLSVSGSVERTPGPDGVVTARLRLTDVDGDSGELHIGWREGQADAVASIDGRIGVARVAAAAAAP